MAELCIYTRRRKIMIVHAFWTIPAVALFLAPGYSAVVERHYAVTYLPVDDQHYSEAIAINSKGEVLVRDFGDVSTCCAGRITSIFLWSEKAGLLRIVEYPSIADGHFYLNDFGEVAGTAPEGNGRFAFIWSAKSGLRKLATFSLGEVTGLNNRGQVVGYIVRDGVSAAFIASDKDGLRYLAPSRQTAARGIDDRQSVVGTTSPLCPFGAVCFDRQAFVWNEKDGLREIAKPYGISYSEGIAVNGRGELLGISADQINTSSPAWTLFVWSERGGLAGKLPVPPCISSGPILFNDRAEVVLTCGSMNEPPHVYTWSPGGAMRDIGTLGYSAAATAINDLGEVVGGSRRDIAAPGHAFIWSPQTGMTDLNPFSLAPASAAKAINNDGVVAGAAGASFGRACIWQPTNGKGSTRLLQ